MEWLEKIPRMAISWIFKNSTSRIMIFEFLKILFKNTFYVQRIYYEGY